MSDPTASRRTTGQRAEEFAASFLHRLGYQVIEANVRFRVGEIDLVCEDGETLAFVEVRARRPGALVSAIESIDVGKQRRLLRAVATYRHDRRISPQRAIRIDVVAVTLDWAGQPRQAELLKNAFGE